MKKILIVIILFFIPMVVSAKQLWQYGSFQERTIKWREISQERYVGNYKQNIKLLYFYEQNLGRVSSSHSSMSMLGDITMNSYNIYGIGTATTSQLTVTATSTFNALTIGAEIVNTYTASTTIAALQPVYLATSTQALQLSDANATSTFAIEFLGFALESGTNGSSILVQTAGIVSGFTGLTAGVEYFVSNTAGSISTTMGQYPIMVGQAISSTQILIDKQKRIGSAMSSEWFIDGTTYYAYSDGMAYGWSSAVGTGVSNYCSVGGITVSSAGGGSTPANAQVFVSCYVKEGSTWIISGNGTSETVIFQPIN